MIKEYDFSNYRTFKELFKDLCYRTTAIDDGESKQDKFNAVLHLLKKYSPEHDKRFKNEVFPLYYDKEYEEQMEFEKEEEEEKIFNGNEFNKWVNKQETSINKELFKSHFSFQTPSALLKELYKTNDKEKNRLLVSEINSGLRDLK